MKLVIAEKPSVALAITMALGVFEKKTGYYEGDGIVVSWCVGHLIQLEKPDAYDPKYTKWSLDSLPIIPENWKYNVIEAAQAQYKVLERLLHSPVIEELICATDAGREGELIFRLLYQFSGCKKPVKRLWISSLEEEAIRKGFSSMKDSRAYDNLYNAALCRAQADWMVGINATRLFSLLYSQTLNVGRVVTPTLSLIVERQEQIDTFVSEPFYTVVIETNNGIVLKGEHVNSREEAERIEALCRGKELTVSSFAQQGHSEKPPKLYDLTALQKDANKLFNFTAQRTLDTAQKLYERKLITYPRTDSCFLTSDMQEHFDELVRMMQSLFTCAVGVDLSENTKQVIDDSLVTDHHAIIPTATLSPEAMKAVTADERDLLKLIISHTLCALKDAYLYDTTEVEMVCNGFKFFAKGKTVTQMGWRSPQDMLDSPHRERNAQTKSDDACYIPQMSNGDSLLCVNVAIKEGKSEPSNPYSEASLLNAMEKAGKTKDGLTIGLGTPATRAGVIEKLVNTGLVERYKRAKREYLKPTDKGTALIAVMPQIIRSASLTAEWEYRLKRIETGEEEPSVFMQDIQKFVCEMTTNVERVSDAASLFPSQYPTIGECPRCGEAILERSSGFFCSNPNCHFGLWKDNRYFAKKEKVLTADMVKAFLTNGYVRCDDLKSAKTGKLFSAIIYMDDDGANYPSFHMEFEMGGDR